MTRGFSFQVLPALIYVLAIFWLGSAHVSIQIPHGSLPQDKLGHFAAFGLLVILALRALRFQYPLAPNGKLVTASVALSSLVGALLEAWQAFFPDRSVELADWVADTLGAILVGLLAMVWLRWRRSRHNGMQPANTAS